jgi:hypothetical protein
MDNNEVPAWDLIIHKVARGVCSAAPGASFEDVKAQLWVDLLEAQSRGELLSLEDGRAAQKALSFRGRTMAHNERRQHLTISVQYGYRTKDVTALFKTFFDREDWYDAIVPEDAYSELGSVALEMSSDLSRAWDRIPLHYRQVIFRKYALNHELNAKEEALLKNAKRRITEILNEYQPAVNKRRKAISNATARYILDSQWDGDE